MPQDPISPWLWVIHTTSLLPYSVGQRKSQGQTGFKGVEKPTPLLDRRSGKFTRQHGADIGRLDSFRTISIIGIKTITVC